VGRPVGVLTIDLEDYRRQELRDHRRRDEPPHAAEVERQLDHLIAVLVTCGARATFFSVGRLAAELSPSVWETITARHRIACHGYEHISINNLGRRGFESDLRAAKDALEDASGQPVLSYRAPYFSGEGCDPWFGETLARVGFMLDSSRRLRSTPPAFRGTLPLTGSGGAVREVPLPAIGYGSKRITVIGGSYLRLLPLSLIIRLLEWAQARGFIPMVYLHPYDLDPTAAPLGYESLRLCFPRLGDWIRRLGRGTADVKLRALARIYEFRPAETLIESGDIAPQGASALGVSVLEIGSVAARAIPPSGMDGPGIGVGDPYGTPLHVA